MSKQTEALKLALEGAANYIDALGGDSRKYWQALAEQETVLPGGGHVPAVPVAVYGYCPECGGAGVMRERRPNGDDKCTNGHKYPSSKALAEQPAQDNTYSYAKNLAEAIFKQHFASDEHYASGRIVWGVNDTVIGILTQIDNMVADMVRRPAQQQEPVLWLVNGVVQASDIPKDYTGCLFTSPPASKPWVGLTDEEVTSVWHENEPSPHLFARAIEAKLREKNT